MIPGQPMPPQAAQMAAPPTPMQAPPPQVPPNVVTIDAVMRLLRDNAHRRFRIDIQVDSTIAGDESRDRAERAQFTESTTKLVEVWGPIIMAQPKATKLAGELLLFNVRGFQVGRALESTIEDFVDELEKDAGIPKPPPQPSPDELIKANVAKLKGQAEITKAQIESQTAQMEAQAKMAQTQMEMRVAAQQHQMDIQKGAMDQQIAHQQAQTDAASNMMKNQIEIARYERAIEAANKPPKTE